MTTQYGDRAFKNALTLKTEGTDPTHAVTKDYVDSKLLNLSWQESVLDQDLADPPGSPTTGNRYIVASSATGDWEGHEEKVAEWDGSEWDIQTPEEGWAVWITDEDLLYVYNGAHPAGSWVKFGSTITHGNLLGLDNVADHIGYLTLDGLRPMTGALSFDSATVVDGTVDGDFLLTNDAGDDFSLLQFGGTTASFPALKRDGTNLRARLADDAADTDFYMSAFYAGAQSTITGSADETQLVVKANATQANTNPLLELQDSAGTPICSFHSDDVTNMFLGVGAGASNTLSGTDGANNLFFGSDAGGSNTSGRDNVAVGGSALYCNATGDYNIVIGEDAGKGASGFSHSENVFIGNTAAYHIRTGGRNTAVGRAASFHNQTGTGNACLGDGAGLGTAGQSYSYNTFIGADSGKYISTGGNNVGIGNVALYYNKTGVGNVAVGYYAGFGAINQSYSYNTLLGFEAGHDLTTGGNNLLLGYKAGDNLTSGANNILIGYDLDASAADVSNELNIGGLYKGDTSAGILLLDGETSVAGDLDASGLVIRDSNPPASAGATGVIGQIEWDADFLYVCVGANTWKRAAIQTWV